MSIEEVTSGNFSEKVLAEEDRVLVDFFAPWCAPCRALSAILEEVKADNPSFNIVKINIDQEQDLARQYKVMSIPTLVVFEGGKEVDRQIGALPKEDILDLL